MKLVQHIQEGLNNLYYSKLRSMLALLGVLVGTASVVAMVMGGQLATHEALKQFKSLGTDLLAVTINSSSESDSENTGKSREFTLAQAFAAKKTTSSILEIAPYTQLYNSSDYEGNPLNTVVLGVTESFADIIHIELQSGRFVSQLDRYQPFCVIGYEVYQSLKKISYKEPLGQQLQIGKNIFTIIGVAKPWAENSFVYANIDHSIIVPILTSTLLSKYATINNLLLRLAPQSDIPAVENSLQTYLLDLLPDKQIVFRSAKELIEKMRKQSDILTAFLALIGSISLLVGGIGVMNIMLVSVVERKREIGIRLAVGATRADIAKLFLAEAVVLSCMGGILGVIIGIGIAAILATLWHWEFTFFWWPPITGFSVSVAVGIFFGFYPAYQASRLNPIEALRSE